MRILPTERSPGNDHQVIDKCHGRNLVSCRPRCPGEQVERTPRYGKSVTPGKPGAEPVALPAVLGDDRSAIDLQRGQSRMLSHARGANKRELLGLRHLLNQRFWPVSVPQSPPDHAAALAEAVPDQGIGVP